MFNRVLVELFPRVTLAVALLSLLPLIILKVVDIEFSEQLLHGYAL